MFLAQGCVFQTPARSNLQAKRSFVTVLLAIAALDSVRLMVARDWSDEGCAKAFKRVSLKTRPNKGGLLAHSQASSATKETWDKATRNKIRNREGPKKRGSSTSVSQGRSARRARRELQVKKTKSATKSQANRSRRVRSPLVEKRGIAPGYRRYLGHPFVCLVVSFILAL